MRLAIGAAVALCILGCEEGLLGTDERSADAAPGDGAAVGPQGVARSYRLRIVDVTECPSPPHERTPPENRRIGVRVVIEAAGGPRRVPVNGFHARLVDAEGHEHRALLHGCEPRLSTAPLRDGEETRGFVTFEVPREATGLRLRYDPRLGKDGDEVTEVPIAR